MRVDFLMKVLLLCIMTMAMDNNEEIVNFDTVYPTSKPDEKEGFSSPDNVIQWLANEATKYGPWPAMDEHIGSETIRYEAEKVAQKKVFETMAENHVVPYESGEIEDLYLEKYQDEVLNPLTKFVNESKENEAKAVSQYFETARNHPEIFNLLNQIMKRINSKKNFVVKPGDGHFGLGVMMCHHKPTQDRWKISYPSIINNSNRAYTNQDFVRQGEYLNKTGDDIIHDLFHYVLPNITLNMKKTWIIEDLIKSEIMTYGIEMPFEIKMAVNYGNVVAIASQGFADISGQNFVWRRDGEVVFFNNEDVESELAMNCGNGVKIHDIQDEKNSHLNGKTGRLDKNKGILWMVMVKEGSEFKHHSIHPRNLFYVGQSVFVKQNDAWIDGNITEFKKNGILVRKKGEMSAFEYNITNVKEFIEGQKVLVTIPDNSKWIGSVKSISPLKVSDVSDRVFEPTDEWLITRIPYPNARNLWNMMQERVSHKMWQEIIATAEKFVQKKQARLARFDIYVPREDEWWISEAEFPRASQPMWFPKEDKEVQGKYYHYLILSTFNDPENYVIHPENKKIGSKLPSAIFTTTTWKVYKAKN